MSEPNVIVREELELLADVQARLVTARPEREASEDDVVADLQRIQAELATAKTEDKPALEQQYGHLVHLLEQLRRGRDVDRVDRGNPYFAHLRLEQDGRVTDIQLGRATCLSEGLRIVDWRHAPVARIYYRYQEGDEYEEDIGPRALSGHVRVRRSVTILDGQLDRVVAPQASYVRHGDAWEEIPAKRTAFAARIGEPGRFARGAELRADKHLPDIAALIDPEQFELISRADSGPVVIRGGAGSGKTTVALHRVAWLAYQSPTRFAPHRMLVVVWGRALRDYVSMVLPSLGVKGVTVTTWSEWSRKLVARHFPHLPDHTNANTPSAVSSVKLHPDLPLLLERFIRGRKAPSSGSGAVEDWKLLLSDRVLLSSLRGVSAADVEATVNWSRSQQQQLLAHEERDKAAEPWLDEEDDAILLRAWQLRVGPMRAKGGGQVRYTHIAVDEVQDFSPMEVAVLLGACDDKRCITLAGDTQQHILDQRGTQRWGDLLAPLGIESTSVSSLRVSYRSTRQITEVARAILGSLVEDDAPATVRDGAPVEKLGFSDHGACVDMLGQALKELLRHEPNASVALIARDPDTARTYADGLDRMDVPRVRWIADQEFSFTPGVDVVDIAQVKGLEFDYVVILDASAEAWPDRPAIRRLLHVAATRAVHQLWITWTGSPSPLLP